MSISNQLILSLWSQQHFCWHLLNIYYNPASQLNKYKLIMLIISKCCPPSPEEFLQGDEVSFGWARSAGWHRAACEAAGGPQGAAQRGHNEAGVVTRGIWGAATQTPAAETGWTPSSAGARWCGGDSLHPHPACRAGRGNTGAHTWERLALASHTRQTQEPGEPAVSPPRTLVATMCNFFPPVMTSITLCLRQQPVLTSSYNTGFCACNTC